jgi:hypothetical protein
MLSMCLALASLPIAQPPEGCFTIKVVDDATGRGVPLVELTTTGGLRYWTDSAGIVAFREPGLLGRRVFFHVRSHGYEYPADGFGYRGIALDTAPGGTAEIRLHRVNIAERLYRVTGAGIYAETLLAGLDPPLREPALSARVVGSDSVQNAVYRGRIYWYWGDTNRPDYPLGNFHTSGATSELPSGGGLDPSVGVDLTYFEDDTGFAAETCRMPGEGPTWIDGLVALGDEEGRERLYAAYAKVRQSMEAYRRGIAVWNDAERRFESVVDYEPDPPVYPYGHPFTHTVDGVEYVYFGDPFPLVRVRADARSLLSLSEYEAYTCLKPGSARGSSAVDRAADGGVGYAWKRATAPVGPAEQAELIRSGALRPEEALLHLRDATDGKPIMAHRGSVYWNPYRSRWVMVVCEAGGTSSYLGEIWFAEADSLLGPWVYARKVVTHDRYSFYNPKQDPMFDQDGGRLIYFEGTYTASFSGNPDKTPRYDYNQIMYRLDLADPRLSLPVAVYQAPAPNGSPWLVTALRGTTPEGAAPAFFAPDRPAPGYVPVYEVAEGGGYRYTLETPGEGGQVAFSGTFHTIGGAAWGRGPIRPKGSVPRAGWSPSRCAGPFHAAPPTLVPGYQEAQVAFYAVPADAEDAPPVTVALYEYVSEGGARIYSVDGALKRDGFRRTADGICRVWPSPISWGLGEG